MAEMADALVSSGMAAAGYDTLNIVCNGWAGRDPKTVVLVENRTLWPSGIAGFAQRLHAMKPPLKVGCCKFWTCTPFLICDCRFPTEDLMWC
jgi:hypothetical protein